MYVLCFSMDKDGSLKIDWNEWREYHFLNPSGHSIHDILQFWRHSSVSQGGLPYFPGDNAHGA